MLLLLVVLLLGLMVVQCWYWLDRAWNWHVRVMEMIVEDAVLLHVRNVVLFDMDSSAAALDAVSYHAMTLAFVVVSSANAVHVPLVRMVK